MILRFKFLPNDVYFIKINCLLPVIFLPKAFYSKPDINLNYFLKVSFQAANFLKSKIVSSHLKQFIDFVIDEFFLYSR